MVILDLNLLNYKSRKDALRLINKNNKKLLKYIKTCLLSFFTIFVNSYIIIIY